MAKKNDSPKKKNIFATLGGWFARMFMGASKSVAEETESDEEKARLADIEEIVSPTRQIVRGFFERKGALVAACIVVAMFILVFVGPLFMPNYSDTYKELFQKNVKPGFNMMSVPDELASDLKMIDSYGPFSVGLSNSGKVYVWGFSELGTTGLDVKNIPDEVKNAKIAWVAAGIDHVLAIGEDGKVYAWGNDRLGQYGYFDPAEFPNIISMPETVLNGNIDVSQIKRVECGYQASVILMNDGSFYIWGNKNAYANLEIFSMLSEDGKLQDIDFTMNYIVAIQQNGNTVYTGQKGLFTKGTAQIGGKASDLKDLTKGKKVVSIDATENNVCLLLDDGSLVFSGDFSSTDVPLGAVPAGEKIVSVASGSHHFSVLTDKGTVLCAGDNTFGQLNVPKKASGADSLITCSFQNYTVNGNGLTSKWGLSGYLFGTDPYGADIFQRIVNGGRMTMTIGAVAVVISSIIGIIIGCLSGYFGGKVDMILMRIEEIFAAIPFLPFALILSSIMGQWPWSENQKIMLIMVILGVLSWTGLARLVRGQVLVAREAEYVTAAKAMGVRESKIAFKHILPNVISVILVTLTLDFAGCLLTESSLSYLGFGVNYPRPTWGNMLNGANNATTIKNFWWQWLFPALFLAITTICINIVGDTLRDVMDPKSNSER